MGEMAATYSSGKNMKIKHITANIERYADCAYCLQRMQVLLPKGTVK